MVYNTGNGTSLLNYQINHTSQEKDCGYYCWKLRKESETLNTFQKILK